MLSRILILGCVCLFLYGGVSASANTYYVSVTSTNPPDSGSIEVVLHAISSWGCLVSTSWNYAASNDTITVSFALAQNIAHCLQSQHPCFDWCFCGWFGGCGYIFEYEISGLSPGDYTLIAPGLLGDSEDHVVQFTIYENGFLDSCEPCLVGDTNGDNKINISDATFLINAIFRGGQFPVCERDADANASGSISIADATAIIAFIFSGRTLPDCE